MTLDPDDIEAIAQRVAARLTGRGLGLVTVEQLARELQVERSWVYARWRELSGFNVAVQEIADAAHQAGAPVTEPSFVETIHRFVLRYIVRPFGAQVMGCATTPRLVIDTDARTETISFKETAWASRDVSIWDLHCRTDGSLVLQEDAAVLHQSKLSATEIVAWVRTDALKLKRQLAADGLMSMTDALYWVQQALKNTGNAQAVAARFDELIVDEAQDTTDTQLRCLQLLKDAGLRSLVMVGDPDQAIYGFAGADPQRLRRLVSDLGLHPLDLHENRRSSQHICNVAVHFSTRTAPDQAVGATRSLAYHPELYVYDPDHPREPVAWFEQRLDDLAVGTTRVAVLCRMGWDQTTPKSASGVPLAPMPLAAPASSATPVARSLHDVAKWHTSSRVPGVPIEARADAFMTNAHSLLANLEN